MKPKPLFSTKTDQEDVIFSICMPGMAEDECAVEDEAEVTVVTNIIQFLTTVRNQKCWCVVNYTSKQSKMCQLTDIKFNRLASEHEDYEDEVRFLSIDKDINPMICEHIQKYPLVEIYSPNGKLFASSTFDRIYDFNVFIRNVLLTKEVAPENEDTKAELDKRGKIEWFEKLQEIDRMHKFGSWS